MKKSYFITFLLLIVQNFLVSCEQLIETDPPNNQVSTQQVFEDPQMANAALAGLYSGLWSNSLISGGNNGMGVLLGSYADELDCYYTGVNNGAKDIYLNQQLPSNTLIESSWNNSYKYIHYANSIIYGVENSHSLKQEDRNRIKGEALLMRSLLYFYLQGIFNEIPYTTTTDYQINAQLNKLTKDEMLQKLESDLTDASNLLTDDYRSPERTYPNRKVAQIMLTKIYLLNHQWIKAEILAKEIIQSPLYQFENDITKVFNNNGLHILWQLKPQNSSDGTQEAEIFYFANAAPNAYALSPNLVSAFSDADLRKSNWMTTVTDNQHIWYRPVKYKNMDGTNSNEYSIIFRLEEVYFILAEALANQNKITEALPYLNATRLRAGLNSLPSTIQKNEFLEELFQEKRRELFTEFGSRFFDLKRQGLLNNLATVKPNWKIYHNAWPLPQQELLLNPNLNPQNQGY
nr:RagB/SusD family nutrient uptake outer membrane protein [Pedobacter sp. ASV2]